VARDEEGVRDLDHHLSAIVSGDDGAFASWLAFAEPVIRGTLRSFAASVDTEAVLQEALLRVWQVAPKVVPDGRENVLLRLGVRIARNLAISEARRARGVELDLEAVAEIPALGPVDPSDPFLRRAIEECRDALPPKPKEALTARLVSGGSEPDAELASKLGMRTNTFLQNFTRARRLLLECLEKHGVSIEAELS
jgi:DNA-directed RNA polymerase specialized sigma24 family protein